MNESSQMTEEGLPSAHYLDLIYRRRWWLGISVVTVWAGALLLSLMLPAKYKSETLVLVEQDSIPVQYVTPGVTIDLQQRLRSLTEQILSRTQLARIATEDGLYGIKAGEAISEAAVDRMRADITIELIKPAGQSDVSAFKISYSAPNPGLAQKVTGQLSSLFIQNSLRDQQQLTEDTSQSLESQFIAAQKELQQQEKQLSDFKKQFLGELPEQMPGNVQILSGLQSRLGAATASLHQAEQQNLYLVSMIGTSRTPGEPALQNATSLDAQIEKMKDELATLNTQYTPRHPDVVHLKERIASAERARRQAEENPVAGTTAPRPARAGSAGGQMESQLKANELEIKNRRQEVKDMEREMGQYQARLNLTPVRQQQLAEVTRNYEQSKAHYDLLMAKKQQSGMATDLANRRKDAQFRMIDPPSLPQAPYWPNRLRFAGIGLFGGLMLGLAMVLVLETADARIHSEDDLKRWTSVPVIATVPPLTTASESRQHAWQRGVEIAVASALVALVPLITFAAYLKG